LEGACRHLWNVFGLFGLAAAYGLETVHRVRQSCEDRRKRKQSLMRYENAMEGIQRQNRTDAEVRRATKRITEFAAQRHVKIPALDWEDPAEEQETTNRRSEGRTKCSIPVDVFEYGATGELNALAQDDSHTAYMRNISSSGIGVLHHSPIDAHQLVLRIALGDDEYISLRVCLLWRRPEKDGWYSSGGKVAEVIADVDAGPTVRNTEQHGALCQSDA